MRIILILWAIPIIFFWGWYGLSAHDINFGFVFLSRGFHDHMFAIYSNMLQMPADEIPVKIAWVFFIDTLFLLGIAAFRWRKSWYPQTRAAIAERIAIWKQGKTAHTEDEEADSAVILEPSSVPIAAGRVHPAE